MNLFYKIKEEQRKKLSVPIGLLIRGAPNEVAEKIKDNYKNKDISFCIGDFVTNNFLAHNIKFKAAVVDFKTERKQILSELKFCFKLFNPRGHVNAEAWNVLKVAVEKDDGCIVFVDGEEDLLALPAIEVSENGNLVVYGQPGEGTVVVEVNDYYKKFVREIILSSEIVFL
ncbi:MAG: GTP-dependent dephospho-CoA kinase family protein [Thermoproteota archaeon]|nr:GTP-dependent dephospho-CoA kinase family protein [Candidatus Brockarchaeota archaeon]MBO3762935.1 GTP-dependent dephospho-CoA kinase family protein [Candidatus Brockarchaeota archaeon]MBO3768350.1 GTP-dependent dephospho-CoA kinase family protein [Candidatus Brockarchaeota archaeon]MBO3800715.1 GTP-dependent dephospho-CoA kinase family protein [Candidatus Brockarchaeota archaeon]